VIILGLSGALGHDPSAALLIDGEVVAAAEEERFVRDKHAKNRMPLESARYCLRAAGVSPRQVDVVAFPYAPISLFSPARWHTPSATGTRPTVRLVRCSMATADSGATAGGFERPVSNWASTGAAANSCR